MNHNTCLSLLALRERAGRRRFSLAQALLVSPNVELFLKDPSWAPRPDDFRCAERQLAALEALGMGVVPIWELPLRLQRVPRLPLALFVRGEAEWLSARAIAIVGSRNASLSAREWARSQAQYAVDRGFAIVSGGAVGI